MRPQDRGYFEIWIWLDTSTDLMDAPPLMPKPLERTTISIPIHLRPHDSAGIVAIFDHFRCVGATVDINQPHHIAAVSVNHNTSAYMELMLRSLFARHQAGVSLSLTIFDNASTDDMRGLRSYATQVHVPIAPSGFSLTTEYNSHGDVLRRFVLDHPNCTHYLFLDADVCFIEANTLLTMLANLERNPTLFGIGPRMSWDGITEIPMAVRQSNPDICDARLHPCCALIPNTPLFRSVVEVIGFACVKYLWAEREEYLDTFKLMTRVMHTHGLHHTLSSALIQHFFCVSYEWDSAETQRHKTEMRDQRLAELRFLEAQKAASLS